MSLAKYLAPMVISTVVSGSLLNVALLAGLPELLRERGMMSFIAAGTIAITYGSFIAVACRSMEYAPAFLAKFWAR